MKCLNPECGIHVPIQQAQAIYHVLDDFHGEPECPVCDGPLGADFTDLLGPGNVLGLDVRAPQFDIAQEIEDLLTRLGFDNGGAPRKPSTTKFVHLLIEAGTGTGKSFAALAPVLASGAKTVYATANKSLQDQLIEDDGPRALDALEQLTGRRPSMVLRKGKANYLCLLSAKRRMTPAQWRAYRDQDGKSQDFDLDTDTTGQAYASRVEACRGKECKHFSHCLFAKTRADAETADLIVTNHHTLAAEFIQSAARGDLDKDSEGILGAYDLIVMDEAHNFSDTYASMLTRELAFKELVADISVCRHLGAVEHDIERLAALEALETLHTQVKSFGEGVKLPSAKSYKMIRRGSLTPGSNSSAYEHALFDAVGAVGDVANIYDALGRVAWKEVMNGEGDLDDAAELSKLSRAYSGKASSLRNLYRRAEVYCGWYEDGAMKIAPIQTGSLLGPRFRDKPAVFMSATLEPFRAAGANLGLPKGTPSIKVASPFNYKKTTGWYHTQRKDMIKPGFGAPPGYLTAYFDRMASEIAEWVELTQGYAMILFASREDLDEISGRLARQLKGMYPLLIQGDIPAPQLAREHVRLAAASREGKHELGEAHYGARGPVTLGMASIWEGVSIKGDHLVNVIIPRIPFPNTQNPLGEARKEQALAAMLDSGISEALASNLIFASEVVDPAITRLRQGTGRLIRSSNDMGICVLLDGKMSRRYGERVLSSCDVAANVTQDKVAAKKLWAAINKGLRARRRKGFYS